LTQQTLNISSHRYNPNTDVLYFRTADYSGNFSYTKEFEDGIYMMYDIENNNLVAISVMDVSKRKDVLYPWFISIGLPTEPLSQIN